jgi:hypothetical protein
MSLFVYMDKYELSLDSPSSANMLLELDITPVLHERAVPWHICLMVR